MGTRVSIESGQRTLEERLQVAAYIGDGIQVRHLIDAGAQVRAHGSLALRLACCRGHTSVARQLVAADPRQLSGYSLALGWAAANGRTETVAMLITAGADARARRDEALRMAVGAGHVDTVRLLLAAGCRFDPALAEDVIELERTGAKKGNGEAGSALIRVLLEFAQQADGDAAKILSRPWRPARTSESANDGV